MSVVPELEMQVVCELVVTIIIPAPGEIQSYIFFKDRWDPEPRAMAGFWFCLECLGLRCSGGGLFFSV